LRELKVENGTNRLLIDYIDSGLLKKDLDLVKSENLLSSNEIYSSPTVIFGWNEKQIYLWSKEILTKKKYNFPDLEAIAVIKRANFITTGHTLTDTQILCCMIALKSGENLKGKLLEVATGEGKSSIVCISAILLKISNIAKI